MSDLGVEKIALPSGGWVALKDPRHITLRMRGPLVALMSRVNSQGDDAQAVLIDEILTVGGVALIAQWSFTEPITADTILDLIDVEDADVLIGPLLKRVPKTAPTINPDDAADPDSPTAG